MRKKWKAVLLSFFCGGLGQLYAAGFKRALLFGLLPTLGLCFFGLAGRYYLAALLFFLLFFLIWFYGMIDAALCVGRDPEGKRSPRYRWYYYLLFYVVMTAIFQGATYGHRLCLYEAFKFPSASMLSAIFVGDHLIVEKYCWSDYQPQRGEIVVFTLAEDPSTNIMKRVIGLPGEKVEVIGSKVLVNDKELNEPYANWLRAGSIDFAADTVPEGTLFLLGDNRDQSRDSRLWNEPFLPIARVKGRGLYVYWPIKRFGVRL